MPSEKTNVHALGRSGGAQSRSRALSANALDAPLLSGAEMQQYFAQGFLALPNFCSEPELTETRDVLGTLFRNRTGHAEGQQFDMLGLDLVEQSMRQPQILNPSTFAPWLLRTRHFRRVKAIARQLLGPYAQFSFDHGILKPPHSAAATPWHQDEAHQEQRWFRYPQISFWLALQDTSITNGCMRYVPNSHLGRLLPHRPLNDDARIHAIECARESFDESLAQNQPVNAGTCIFHDVRTLHGALPNVSDAPRLAYIVAFVGPPERAVERITPARFARRSAQYSRPASELRRLRWILRGGVVTILVRRIRQGLRSHPRMLWWKMRMLAANFTNPPR